MIDMCIHRYIYTHRHTNCNVCTGRMYMTSVMLSAPTAEYLKVSGLHGASKTLRLDFAESFVLRLFVLSLAS